ELDDVEPPSRGQPHAAANALLETERDADPAARDADRREVPDGTPQLEAHVHASARRAERVERWRRQIELAHDRGGLRDRPPPACGRALRRPGLRDQELRLRAACRERLDEREDVRAVAGVPRLPGSRALGAEELVEG